MLISKFGQKWLRYICLDVVVVIDIDDDVVVVVVLSH